MKFAVLIVIFYVARVGCQTQTNEICILDRDEPENRFSWMLKVVAVGDNIIKSLGFILTPIHIVTASAPLITYGYGSPEDWEKIRFVGVQYELGGETFKCEAVRRGKTQLTVGLHNIYIWEIDKRFETTPFFHFLWKSTKEINAMVMESNVKRIENGEMCQVHLFSSDNSSRALYMVTKVRFIAGEDFDLWTSRICKAYKKSKNQRAETEGMLKSHCIRNIKKYHVLAMTVPEFGDWPWVQGAVFRCRGHPIGTLSKIVDNLKERIMMIEKFDYIAETFHDFTVKEWPKWPPNATIRTTTTVTTTTTTTTTTPTTTTEVTTKTTSSTARPDFCDRCCRKFCNKAERSLPTSEIGTNAKTFIFGV